MEILDRILGVDEVPFRFPGVLRVWPAQPLDKVHQMIAGPFGIENRFDFPFRFAFDDIRRRRVEVRILRVFLVGVEFRNVENGMNVLPIER